MSILQRALDKAVLGLFQVANSAFLTTIYCGLHFNWDKAIPTACTNGKYLKINPDWFLTLTERSRVALLAHELWHVAFMHMVRLGNRDPQLWNMAADHAINLMLLRDGYHFDMDCLADPRFTNMSSEQIYKILESESTRVFLPFGTDFTGEAGEKPGTGEQDDDGSNQESSADLEAEITALVIRANTMQKMSGTPGKLPGELEEALERLLNPVIPWERLLNRWLTERSESGYTWTRPSRRFTDDYLPSRGGEDGLAHLVWAIDTSGSMSPGQMLRANSEIRGAQEQFSPERITIISFDTEVRDTWEFTRDHDITSLTIHGRGGTDMQPAFDLVRKLKPTALVMMSDMQCEIPEPIPGVQVLWLCFDDPDWEAPYGTTIHVDT